MTITKYNLLHSHVLEIVRDLEFCKNYDFIKYLKIPKEERTNFLELRKDEYTSKEILALFDKFKEFTYKKYYSEIDYTASFAQYDLIYDEYEFFDYDSDQFDNIEVYRHKDHKTLVSIKDSELIMTKNAYDCILFVEVELIEGYAKESIYSWINCGEDVEKDLRQFVYTQEDFLEMKTHLEDDSPFIEIDELYDDQVIFLN